MIIMLSYNCFSVCRHHVIRVHRHLQKYDGPLERTYRRELVQNYRHAEKLPRAVGFRAVQREHGDGLR